MNICRVVGLLALFLLAVTALLFIAPAAHAGNNWDASDNTQWWFDPMNWSTNVLPPTNGTAPPGQGSTDTDIITTTDALPGGEGVVFDPSNNDPNFANAFNLVSTLPAGFGPQYSGTTYTGYNIAQLYVGRAQGGSLPVNTKLTIKGDLNSSGNVLIGRSSGTRNVAVNATVVQTAGLFTTTGSFDLGQVETSQNGYGNATYDYRGGSLFVNSSSGLRLSAGSVSAALDTLPGGAAGIGKIIVHNPTTPGYVRATTLVFSSFPGVPASTDGGLTSYDPDGVTKGVSIAEFHYQNGGVRPIQVAGTLTINNGRTDPGATPATTDTNGVRSARLGLVLDAAPTVLAGVPQNLPLIDVDYSTSDFFTGAVTGSGDLNGDAVYNNDRVFSDEFAANPLSDSASLRQDSIVSAVFGSTKYNWKVSYTGLITYTGGDAGADTSSIASIASTGGLDVVLMGLSTEPFTPPGVPGDYNNNGIVDAADYTVWRDHLGQSFTLPNRDSTNSGVINAGDYTFWVNKFGTHSGAGAGLSGGAVPEPSTMVLALVGLIGIGAFRRQTA